MSTSYKKSLSSKKGFTLVELLVVVSIIGLLSSIVVSSLNTARAKGRDAVRMSTLHQVRTAVEAYFNDNGFYPQCTGPNDLCTSTGYQGDINTLAIKPTYMSSVPLDPTNINGQYGYYYARGYKQTAQYTFINNGRTDNYILSTRLETKTGQILNGGTGGWNNTSLNYLLGSSQQ